MIRCPECSSARTKSLLTIRDDRQDDHALTITKYRCLSCGCRFELREHWEIQVTAYSKELKV